MELLAGSIREGVTMSKIETEGIESTVLNDAQEEIGHVVLLDLDEQPRAVAESIAERIDGPAVLVRSDPGSVGSSSYHVYGLELRPWDRAIDIAREIDAVSAEYVEEMDRRGVSTLRIGSKGDAPAPEVVAVDIPDDPDAAEISAPHCSILEELTDGELSLLLRSLQAGITDYKPAGSLVARTRYETDGRAA